MLTAIIVEDNVYDRECIQKFVDWAALDIEVLAAAINGEEGLARCIELRPDIVLSDISMPKMDGLEMVGKITEAGLSPQVIIMSCHDEFEYARTAIGLNVVRYVMKPVDVAELQDALAEAAQAKWEEAYQRVNARHMAERAAKTKPVLVGDLIRELTQLRTEAGPELERRMQYLGINLGETQVVTVFQMDGGIEPGEEGSGYELAALLKTAVEDVFTCPGFAYVLDDCSVCAVLCGVWQDEEDFLEDVLPRLNTLRELMRQQNGRAVTVGVSPPVKGLEGLSGAFRAASQAVSQRFYSPGGRILLASHIEADQAWPATPDFTKMRANLREVMEDAGEDGAQIFVESLLPGDVLYAEAYMRETGYMMALAVQLHLEEAGVALADIPGFEGKTLSAVTRLGSAQEIRDWLLLLVQNARQHLRRQSGSRRASLVGQIKAIIDEDYAAIKNIGQVAEQVYTSAGHANMLFKQEAGITIGDYLFERRMEAAKALLRNPHCRVYEVAEQVGYVSKSYFSNAFKEYCGCTPREYRDRNCIMGGV